MPPRRSGKKQVRAALEEGSGPPPRPAACELGAKPPLPRLVLSDATTERLAVILSERPRGTLVVRDELAGWLQSMTRYTSSSDRPFWLEAYGGRAHMVERMGRDPVHVDHLTIGVVRGIQPGRLSSLLLKTDDDGLLARLLPIWPDPAPLTRPAALLDAAFAEQAFERLLTLQPNVDPSGHHQPSLIHFSDSAQDRLDAFQTRVRAREGTCSGLLLSFLGKLPSLAVRLSLVVACLDWAAGGDDEPHAITVDHLDRAVRLVEVYLVPMAERAYAEASGTEEVSSGRRLVVLIQEERWTRFTSREVQRKARKGLTDRKEIDRALETLEHAGLIQPARSSGNRQRGHPERAYLVHPDLHEGGS